MAQFFKGDSEELKYYNSGAPILGSISLQRDSFLAGAYSSFVLGDVLFDNERSPLANAIPRNIFREAFETIFDAFVVAGTFESYLTVFRNIFGPEVDVTFTVPGPGKLNIDIVTAGVAVYDFVARTIVDDEYVYDEIIDDEGDNIIFRGIKGFESQYELEKMLFEMVPNGIYTEITLTIGEEE